MMSQRLKLVLLGAGRVATHLVRHFAQCLEIEILQVYSRQLSSAEDLVESYLKTEEASVCDELSEVRQDADIYLFALSDSALNEVWSKMPPSEGLWLHTAGSVSLLDMASYHSRVGVLYPLQTFSKERSVDWSSVPLYLEVLHSEDKACLLNFAEKLSSVIHWVGSEQRLALHCSAVFACNFTNHMLALSELLLEDAGLQVEDLKPLIRETFHKFESLSAKQVQTGPAIRRDLNTMTAHLNYLEGKKTLGEVYRLISKSIQELDSKS